MVLPHGKGDPFVENVDGRGQIAVRFQQLMCHGCGLLVVRFSIRMDGYGIHKTAAYITSSSLSVDAAGKGAWGSRWYQKAVEAISSCSGR